MINIAGDFEKVSFEQFLKDMRGTFDLTYSDEEIKMMYDAIELPARATSGSAGNDFHAPFTFSLNAGASIKIPTGIRAKIEEGWWLGCLPRSSLGFKYRVQLDNTMGVIDSDYYGSDNEGHIFAKITNDSKNKQVVIVGAGDAFMQAIFIPYGVTQSDSVTAVRNGGFGSTDRETEGKETE